MEVVTSTNMPVRFWLPLQMTTADVSEMLSKQQKERRIEKRNVCINIPLLVFLVMFPMAVSLLVIVWNSLVAQEYSAVYQQS